MNIQPEKSSASVTEADHLSQTSALLLFAGCCSPAAAADLAPFVLSHSHKVYQDLFM